MKLINADALKKCIHENNQTGFLDNFKIDRIIDTQRNIETKNFEWISVKEKLPDVDGHYMVFFNDHFVDYKRFDADTGRFHSVNDFYNVHPLNGIVYWAKIPYYPDIEYLDDCEDEED